MLQQNPNLMAITKQPDPKKISDDMHELKKAAKSLQTSVPAIMLAKQYTGSNKREDVENWIKQHKGTTVGVLI